MRRVVVVEPPEPAVTLAEAKAHLRVDTSGEDAYIEGLIAAAQGWIDGPEGWLGRAIGVQTLEVRMSGFPGGVIALPYRPAIETTRIAYVDGDGEAAILDPEQYETVGYMVRPVFGASWPSAGEVRVRYRAGYDGRVHEEGGTGDAPPGIKHAILLLVGQWYAAREAVSVGAAVSEMPFAVEALLAPHRVWA